MAKKRLTREELENLLNEKEKENKRLHAELNEITNKEYILKGLENAKGYQMAIREVLDLLRTIFKKEGY